MFMFMFMFWLKKIFNNQIKAVITGKVLLDTRR